MLNDFWILMKQELALTVLIFFLLIVKLGKGMKNETLLVVMQLLLLLNLIGGCFFNKAGVMFDGMYYTGTLITLQKNILNLGIYLITLLNASWLRRNEHLPEFMMLMLSALLGMFFMISSGNLLMFFLSLELSTIPVAAMANFDLEKKISSEAAMKMILSSAFSSGVLLFGISLVYGSMGTINFVALPGAFTNLPLQIFAFIFVFAAFAFKLSVVPFHLWTADVYEGAPIATTSFLSVISKGSMAFILMTALFKVFAPLVEIWYNMIMILSIATMIIGNLFALRQQSIKRFLAFSSIAQVGFILVGISSDAVPESVTAVTYFILVYIFSNLAAFGVAAVISAQTGKEYIDDYRGLYKTNKFLSWMMALALFSLAGIPPTAGFFGKLYLLASGAIRANYMFLTIAALNMIVSLYYYLRVVRAMFMENNEQPIGTLKINGSERLGLVICGIGIVIVGFLSWVYDYIQTLY